MTKSVYIIILNWNDFEDTIECVESCLKLDYSPYRIIVVDNGSDDGSETYISDRFPGLKVIQTGANLGYAGGNNAGIRYALEEGAEYIWLLNNDTLVDSRALTELVGVAETDLSTGLAGSKILSYSQPSVLLYAGGRVDLTVGETEHVGYGCEDAGQFDETADTAYITGCSLLVKRQVIEDIGMMNEAYFLYFEETEWCVKARCKGYRLVYVPKSVVFHKESVSVHKIKGLMLYYMTRNRLHFMKEIGINNKWLKRFGKDLHNLLKYAARLDPVQVRCMFTAYLHWIIGYMGPLDGLRKVK